MTIQSIIVEKLTQDQFQYRPKHIQSKLLPRGKGRIVLKYSLFHSF
jgi:hypothetical protein